MSKTIRRVADLRKDRDANSLFAKWILYTLSRRKLELAKLNTMLSNLGAPKTFDDCVDELSAPMSIVVERDEIGTDHAPDTLSERIDRTAETALSLELLRFLRISFDRQQGRREWPKKQIARREKELNAAALKLLGIILDRSAE